MNETTAAPVGAATSSRAKILLVDDRAANLVALEAILGSLNQTLVRAGSGEDALRALLHDDFALILLDAQMPGMDGFETASRIKARERTKDIPIIFLTANDFDTHLAYRGYATGAADFLAKPFDPWLLRAKVQVFVDLWHASRKLSTQADLLRRSLDERRAVAPGGVDVDVVADLRSRLAGVEEAVADLDVGTDMGPGGDARRRLAQRIDDLRQALDALG
ncbi:CheY-like chemotaxis protein [Nocardioides luteus]|uniref:Response regulator n=1 Tax=Nocardioides luteus TaxID=1844 RepID=A0ABQ5SXQ4_9ACTN|nr:response regulator [Nocardioides luteus]MDR7312007.1 CheY-like chemotaxis protein [Nocardioides luteus]GGR74361.1 response regulator [Nocardioides luteus]GLJ68252.1 response regulator [Nocardioides luteus]